MAMRVCVNFYYYFIIKSSTRNRPAGSVAGSDRAQVEPGGHGWLVITQVGQSHIHLSPRAARLCELPLCLARGEAANEPHHDTVVLQVLHLVPATGRPV